MARVLFVITEDWALITHRLHLVKDAIAMGHSVAVATRVGVFQDHLEQIGVTVFDWKLERRSMNLFREWRSILQLGKIIRHFRPDLIHSVALKPVIYCGLLARFNSRQACIFALGGVGFVFSSKSFKARLLQPVVLFFLSITFAGKRHRLILQNADDRRLMVRSGVIDPNKIRLIRGAGVEKDIFAPSPLPHGKSIVILPARLLWDKGVGEFYEAAKKLKPQWPDARFVIVGDPDLQNPAAIPLSKLDEWIASGVVENWRRVSHHQMPAIYAQAMIVCLPSYREGLPKALLEAASSARPLVAFDVSGCRDIVRDGITGILIPQINADLLAEALSDLLSDHSRCVGLGTHGRKMIEDEYASEIINQQTFAVWDELLADAEMVSCK